MKPKLSFLLLIIDGMLFLFLMFPSYGCSLIGFGVGAAIDNSKPPV